ncbi:hypothetical protein [Methanobacterium oryzae]|uniref:hypothetical protein n=1 Tax=Methanobacterium oryzae TaxID=69540 RepID=UPI003D1CF7EA
MNNDNQTENPIDKKRKKWIKRLTIIVAIWGILSLFSAPIFGIIFILFAILIHVSKSFVAIYAVGIILWILAILQILNATGITEFTVSATHGTELILVAIVNFAIGALIIYRTRKLEKV